MSVYGWAGRILRVNLSTGRIESEPLPESLRRDYIGGRGVNARLLWDEVPAGLDAFDPANRLIFGTGPLVGTTAPGAGRFNVTTRSPQGYLGDSNCGGHWALELKLAGFDHVLIHGRAETPVYLWIHDGQAELRDATPLHGWDTWQTQAAIKDGLGDPEVQVACIGPAGENRVRFATIRTGPKRSAGRTGTGAVMGSKHLKAVAVRGTGRVHVADPPGFAEAVRDARDRVEDFKYVFGALAPYGGTYGQLWFRHNDASMMVTRHHQSGWWEQAEELDPRPFHDLYRKRMTGCSSCPIQCTPYFEVHDSPFGTKGEIDYESVAAFGAAPAVTDRFFVYEAAVTADRLGLDCDSGGRVISFAMELAERGILTERDVGFPLRWGDGQALLRLIGMMARREGFGDVLAEGEERAARIIGRGAEKYALTVKGVEQHEPLRSVVGHALGQSTSTRGSDHLRSSHHAERDMSPEEAERFFGSRAAADPLAYEGKAAGVLYYEYNAAMSDMLETCRFLSPWLSAHFLDADISARLLTTATGLDVDGPGLLRCAERVINVERAFIAREGVRRQHDYPPDREFDDPYPAGPFAGQRLDRAQYDRMLDEYYRLHGWDVATGIPTPERLTALGLPAVAAAMRELRT